MLVAEVVMEELLSSPFTAESERVSISLLPDHPTPIHLRTHTAEHVPFCIYYPGIEPDGVQTFDEIAAQNGAYGTIEGDAFIKEFMKTTLSH